MDFENLILQRFSVRDYKNTPVDDDKLNKILEAGRLAPSAVNFQPWYFIVARKPETLHKLHGVYHREWFSTAPIVIAICCDPGKSWKRPADGHNFGYVDAAIAIGQMTLQATELGLGSCWVCNFDVNKCREVLNIPENIEPVALLPVGYPNIPVPEKKRKPLSEIVRWESF